MIYDTSDKIMVAPSRAEAAFQLLQYGIIANYHELSAMDDITPLTAMDGTTPLVLNEQLATGVHVVTSYEDAMALDVPIDTPWCRVDGSPNIPAMEAMFGPPGRISDVLNVKTDEKAIHPKLLTRA